MDKTALLSLADRVDRRPSLFMTTMRALAVWLLAGIPLHMVNDWLLPPEWVAEYIQSLGTVAALLTWWQIRYAPVAKLTASLRALAEMEG